MTTRTKPQLVEQPITHYEHSDSTHIEKSSDDQPSPLPEYIDQWNSLAAHYYTNGDYNKSIKAYQKALVIYPNTSFLLNNLAAAQSCNSQHGKALQNVIKSMSFAQNYYDACSSTQPMSSR